MKDILIVVSPSQNEDHEAYKAIRKEILKHGTETQQILYTTFLLTGPKLFENAMSIISIADQHGFDNVAFEVESVLKRSADMKNHKS